MSMLCVAPCVSAWVCSRAESFRRRGRRRTKFPHRNPGACATCTAPLVLVLELARPSEYGAVRWPAIYLTWMRNMRMHHTAPFLGILLFAAGCANLAWDSGPKSYMPGPSSTLNVAGLGVDGPVDILSPFGPFTATRTLTNTSSTTPASAGYAVTDTIVRWVFVAAAGRAGWVPGDPATHTVFSQTVSGPALAPGASTTIGFGPVLGAAALPCGLYRQTITADSGGALSESSKSDNVTQHFFFIPSTQQFNIAVNALLPGNTMFHEPAVPTATHNFTITTATTGPPTAPPAPQWVFAHFTWQANEGSMADAMPPPAAPGGPAPQLITMRVTPRTHGIPALGFAHTVTGKITVISRDGCVIKQESATVLVEHKSP